MGQQREWLCILLFNQLAQSLGRRVAEELDDFLGCHWTAEVVALVFIAFMRFEELEMSFCFDPLRENFEPQGLRQNDDARRDDAVIRLGDILDERTIDLESIDRELAQIRSATSIRSQSHRH